MSEELRLLHVEHSERDAESISRELTARGYRLASQRVETLPALEDALRAPWDIVLCEYAMPSIDAPTALAAVRRADFDLPFIVVSTSAESERAVEMMRAGANDFLRKADLGRLGPCVARELVDGRTRREKRRAGAADLHTRESFESIVGSAQDPIVVERDGRIAYANRVAAQSLGWSDATLLVGQRASDVVIERGRRLADGRPHFEERWRHRDGTALALEVAREEIVFDGAPAVAWFARDMSERTRLVAAMIEIDRMASIGILAASIAHEINNPLAYVLANLEFVTGEIEVFLEELPSAAAERLAPRIADMRQALGDTNHGAERVRDIVGDLRTFSRSADESVVLVDVRQVLDSALRMAAVQMRQRATIVREYGEVPNVLANEARLGQVFLNLVVNAAQALPEGLPATNRITLRTRTENGEIVVEVTDTGCGIPADLVARIFDPFFTTKPIGQGTGLGLSICQRTVHALGGRIAVVSAPDVETTFTLHLPAAPATPPA